MQQWIEGASDAGEWVKDFAGVLRQVHAIRLGFFGYLADGPRYRSLAAYYAHIYEVVDRSFGEVLKPGHSIWDLDELGITSPGFLPGAVQRIRELSCQIHSEVEPVLVHGDMFPSNLIYSDRGPVLIDWDEARANWWVYEIARTLFYAKSRRLFDVLIDAYGDHGMMPCEIDVAMRLEHVRQLLRILVMACFKDDDIEEVRSRVRDVERQIRERLDQPLLDW